MKFIEIVHRVLMESLVAGGDGSVFGSNVGATATPFSGDNYASGDARKPSSLLGGVMTRSGMKSKKRKKTKKNYKKRK